MSTARARRLLTLGSGLFGLAGLCVLLTVMACDERAAERGVRDGAPPGDAPSPRTALPEAHSPLAVVAPAAFARACLRGDTSDGTPWTLSEVDARLTPLAFERIEALVSRDSARLAARIAGAVDVLPSDTARADFRGLPVVVRAAWRVVPAPGDTVVAALVARRLPIESDPLEELFFLVAAPGQRQGVRDPLVEGWVMRDVGSEEEVAVRELVAVLVEADALTLVLAHDADDGVRIEILSRRASAWGIDWSGPMPACGP